MKKLLITTCIMLGSVTLIFAQKQKPKPLQELFQDQPQLHQKVKTKPLQEQPQEQLSERRMRPKTRTSAKGTNVHTKEAKHDHTKNNHL
jgi:hypothetical protein